MKMLERLGNISDNINIALERIAVFLLTVMTGIILTQVFARYFFSIGLRWSEEIGKYLMVWMALLGAVVVFYEQRHIAIDFLIAKFNNLRPVKIFHLVLALALFAIIVWQGIPYAIFGLKSISPATGISRFWVYLALPVSGGLLFFQGFVLLLNALAGKIKQHTYIDEIQESLEVHCPHDVLE